MALQTAKFTGIKVVPLSPASVGAVIKGHYQYLQPAPPDSDYPDSKSLVISVTENLRLPIYDKTKKDGVLQDVAAGERVKVNYTGQLKGLFNSNNIQPGTYLELTYTGRSTKKFKGKFPYEFTVGFDKDNMIQVEDHGEADEEPTTSSSIEQFKRDKKIV